MPDTAQGPGYEHHRRSQHAETFSRAAAFLAFAFRELLRDAGALPQRFRTRGGRAGPASTDLAAIDAVAAEVPCHAGRSHTPSPRSDPEPAARRAATALRPRLRFSHLVGPTRSAASLSPHRREVATGHLSGRRGSARSAAPAQPSTAPSFTTCSAPRGAWSPPRGGRRTGFGRRRLQERGGPEPHRRFLRRLVCVRCPGSQKLLH